MQGRAPVEHAGIHSSTSQEQELNQAPLLGLHGQMQCRLATGALLEREKVVTKGVQRQPEELGPGRGLDGGTGPVQAPHLSINLSSILEQ